MRRRPSPSAPEDAAVRFAWWSAFLATLALVALLGVAKSAQALTIPPVGPEATPTLAFEDDLEYEAEVSEEEEFEAEEECEEGEEECEEEGAGLEAPRECLLASAEATVFATAGQDKVRLQVRYKAAVPTAVSVTYGLHGGKGSLFLGDEKKQFARQGVLRLTRSLTDAQMTKVMAAKGFTVRLRVPSTPGYCKAFFDHQLNLRRATPSGLSWQQAR